jgi:uncharacterized oxidoreductase
MPQFPAETLQAFANSLLQAAGVPAADAGIVARHLVGANLAGHDSHGIMRIPQYLQYLREGKFRPGVGLDILSETPAVLAADANWGLGQVQAHRLLARLVTKAKGLGVAAGTLRHCGHIGRLGEYAETAAVEGLAFFGTVNSHGAGRRVAPPGGTEGRISTNPICMAVPTAGEPVVLDFGTSVVAEGKVRVQYQKRETVPDGWLVDADRRPTTDPGVLYAEPRGTILPFGGPQAYKGFGLGLLLDLFAGGLSGGRCSHPEAPLPGVGNAVLFVVFDPAMFGGAESFLRETTGLTEYVRGCPTGPGVERITLPGDPELAMRAKRSDEGISIPDGTWALLVKEAETLGVPVPG